MTKEQLAKELTYKIIKAGEIGIIDLEELILEKLIEVLYKKN